MSTKRRPLFPPDFEVDADETPAATCKMPAGSERTEALEEADRLQNAADDYGLILAATLNVVTGRESRDHLMRNKKKAVFLTADQLEERAAARISQAEQLPPGEARQHALKNAAQLRSYALMKRLLAPARSKVAAKSTEGPNVGN